MDDKTSNTKATIEVVPNEPIVISVKEAARLLNLTPWSVYQLCESGALVSGMNGRRRQVSMASVRKYADQVLRSADLPIRRRRPWGFSIEVRGGALFVDWRDYSIVSFRPGWFLTVGRLNIISNREEDRLEQMWTETGREGERLRAERAKA